MKKHLWWVAIVALGLALVGQYTYRYSELSRQMIVQVAYPEVATFREVLNKANTVVQAEVISVEAGPDNVTKLDAQSGEPNQESRLPTQRITVRVQSAEKGNAAAGQDLIVHRTGGQVQLPEAPARGSIKGANSPEIVPPPGGANKPAFDSPAPPPPPARVPDPNAPAQVSAQILNMEGEPPYTVGERVFLALEERPGAQGVQQPVHPAGRYRVQANGAMQAVYDDQVSQSVAGRQVAEAARAARGELEIPTRPQVQRRVGTGEGEPGMPTTGSHSHTQALDQALWFTWLGVAVIVLGLAMLFVSLLPSRRRIR